MSEENYLAEELDDKLPNDNPAEVVDVATQTEAKHSNRRYIHCNIPNKLGKKSTTVAVQETDKKVSVFFQF